VCQEAKKQKERAKALGLSDAAKKAYPPAAFIKKCLQEFYTANAPEKLANLDKIMEKFSGKWPKLEAGLKKAYAEKAPDFCKLYESKKK